MKAQGTTVSAAIAAAIVLAAIALGSASAQSAAQPDWSKLEAETMRHYQALLRMDTSDTPGHEQPAAEYLKEVLEKEGIPVQVLALEPERPNVVARLKGSGKKR